MSTFSWLKFRIGIMQGLFLSCIGLSLAIGLIFFFSWLAAQPKWVAFTVSGGGCVSLVTLVYAYIYAVTPSKK